MRQIVAKAFRRSMATGDMSPGLAVAHCYGSKADSQLARPAECLLSSDEVLIRCNS